MALGRSGGSLQEDGTTAFEPAEADARQRRLLGSTTRNATSASVITAKTEDDIVDAVLD